MIPTIAYYYSSLNPFVLSQNSQFTVTASSPQNLTKSLLNPSYEYTVSSKNGEQKTETS